jgi:transposase
MACQWVWNLRLSLGKAMQKAELREIEWASPKETLPLLPTVEEPVEEYGPWQWAAALGRATGRFGADAFTDAGRMASCAVQQRKPELRAKRVKKMPLRERAVYLAYQTDWKPGALREQCLASGAKGDRARRVSAVRRLLPPPAPPFVEPWARMTKRLFQILQVIGLATGGRLGVCVTDRLGIATSRQTIVRRIMALPTEPFGPVIELGIDDFSFRRGRSFGTILVNLQTRQIIDVLADRKAETSAAWMAGHPEIELVSRDRGADYASAAATGAPQAVQCADRFHLLQNLGEVLEGCLARQLAAQRKTQTLSPPDSPPPIGQAPRSVRRSPKVEQRQLASQQERLARYEQVLALRKRGFSHQAIADQVGIGHATVQRWIAAGALPETRRGPYVSQVDPYLPYLFERWESGCHHMVRLHQELVAQGYKGSYASVRDHLIRRLPGEKKNGSSDRSLVPAPLPSKQATFLFLRRPDDLDEEEREQVQKLRQISEEVDLAYDLVQQFAQMLRTRAGEKLDTWLALALSSQIPEFRSFVAGIKRDKAAVVAGLTLSQSNGLVEGKVLKLKLIKRMGYGRAGFPLLRQRVLHAL